MIVDKLNELSDGQVVTAAAASTNTYDFGQASPTPGSAGLFQMKIQECDTETGTFTDLLTGPQVTIPDEGLILDMALPAVTKRYLRAYYTPTKAAGESTPNAKATVSTIITWGVEQQSGWKGSTAYMQTK